MRTTVPEHTAKLSNAQSKLPNVDMIMGQNMSAQIQLTSQLFTTWITKGHHSTTFGSKLTSMTISSTIGLVSTLEESTQGLVVEIYAAQGLKMRAECLVNSNILKQLNSLFTKLSTLVDVMRELLMPKEYWKVLNSAVILLRTPQAVRHAPNLSTLSNAKQVITRSMVLLIAKTFADYLQRQL